MQVFELHFNPKLREGQIFDSFVYEPENVYERKLGSLYMVGELKNTLPQNLKFLDNLAIIIKKNYYTLSLKSPEKALSECLKKVNDYLGKEVKKDNVSWLGNLNFSVLSLKDFNLFFTKTGDLKILLIRGGRINDIGKSLDAQEIDPYPLKVFLNIVSGKLTKGDIILILTKEIFSFFQEQNILTKFALSEEINSKKIKEILPASLFAKGEGKNISGICFLFVVKPELLRQLESHQPRRIRFQKEKNFSLSQNILSFLKPIKSIPNIRKRFSFKISLPKLPKLKLPKIKLPRPKIKIPLKLPNLPVERFPQRTELKKKLILILILIFILLLGYLIF